MWCQAKFFDGTHAASYQVEITTLIDGVEIKYIDSEGAKRIFWKYTSIFVTEESSSNLHGVISYSESPNARCEILDFSMFKAIQAKLPKKSRKTFMVSATWKVIGFLLIISVATIVAIWSSMPFIAHHLAKDFPKDWEEAIGQYVVEQLVKEGSHCNSPSGIKALNSLVDKLVEASGSNKEFDVKIIREKDIMNAFAAPGGKIIIFSKMLDNANGPDEIAGVLGHEMSHVIKLHTTEGLIHNLGLLFVVNVLFAGAGEAANLAFVAQTLYQMDYSQDAESEADMMAVDILYKARIDREGLATFFEKLQKEEAKIGERISEYFSTHPATSKRIKRIREFDAVKNPAPSLSKKEWIALKNICKKEKSMLR